jgi:hypothetical protein
MENTIIGETSSGTRTGSPELCRQELRGEADWRLYSTRHCLHR